MIVGHFGTMDCNGAGVDISPSCNENVIGISWEIATFWGCCSGGSITREEMARWPGGRAPSTVSFPNTSAWHCFSMWNPEYRRICLFHFQLNLFWIILLDFKNSTLFIFWISKIHLCSFRFNPQVEPDCGAFCDDTALNAVSIIHIFMDFHELILNRNSSQFISIMAGKTVLCRP